MFMCGEDHLIFECFWLAVAGGFTEKELWIFLLPVLPALAVLTFSGE